MQAVSRQAALGAGCNEQCVMISRPSHTRPGAVPGQGIGGVLLFDVGAAAGPVPSGPRFMSPEWREKVYVLSSEFGVRSAE